MRRVFSLKGRMLAALAALLALAPLCAAPAFAEGTPEIEPDAPDAVIAQSSCSIVQSGDYYLVYCFAQVHNPTDMVLCLDNGYFELYSGQQTLATQEVSRLWPYFLAPGQDGYFFDIVAFEPNEDGVVVPSITGIEYFVQYMPVEARYAGTQLGCTARIERDPQDDMLYVVCELSNPGEAPAYDPSVSFGLYTQSGAMIYADGMTLQSVGVPAGGTTLARFTLDDVFLDQWESYGATPTQARANAVVRNDSD